ncbi:hypothetical protein GCM10009741_65620 [Kribbella lupini]|uniref:Uncharacterized protein n=1 Tax=Kribbella lupini TaxID=291602 RepID=A0ABP4N1S3_9ACTN
MAANSGERGAAVISELRKVSTFESSPGSAAGSTAGAMLGAAVAATGCVGAGAVSISPGAVAVGGCSGDTAG